MFGRRLESLLVLFISISIISTASATLITGSEGITYIIGNNPDYSNGSFKVQIDYALYDGLSSTDPKGITNDTQIALTLTNLLEGGGESPVLTIGRLTVFAPNPSDANNFYVKPVSPTTDAYVASSPGTRAPRIVKYHPQNTPTLPNCVEFIFDTGSPLYTPTFAPGEMSKQLILRTPATNLPATILLEIDSTNSVPSCDGEVYITIPEPCSIAFLGGALLFAVRRFVKK